MTERAFEYSNLSGRPHGPVLTVAGRFLPGVREVQRQVVPYARAWQEHNPRGRRRRPAVGALGDSMAQGVGASRHDRGWVGQLADLVPARLADHRLVNLSASGGLVEDLIERQLPAMESLDATPDLVTVIIDSFDLFSPRHRRTLPARLAELLARLPTGTVMATQPRSSPASTAFNRQLDEAAHEGRLVLAEFRDPRMRSWRGRLAQDRFHPNDLGYAGMAQIMAEALRRH